MDKFILQMTSKNSAHKEMKEVFLPIFKKIGDRAEGLKISQKMHAHDLLSALANKLLINGFTNKCLEAPDELGRLMLASLEWALVTGDATLMRLKAKFPPLVKSTSKAF
jgi:hypothetical protein